VALSEQGEAGRLTDSSLQRFGGTRKPLDDGRSGGPGSLRLLFRASLRPSLDRPDPSSQHTDMVTSRPISGPVAAVSSIAIRAGNPI